MKERKTKDDYVLLMDVGGTFTKIAVAKNKKIISSKILETKELQIEDVKRLAEDYRKSGRAFSSAAIACAGPVIKGKCQITHANLYLDEKVLENALGSPVRLLNDLEAAAYCLREKNKSTLLISFGTGLGVSFIDERGKIISSEEGHLLIERELFFAIPELRSTLIPQYENLLGSRTSVLMKLLKKDEKQIVLKEANHDGTKDRFTEIYLQVLDSFIQKMISVHEDIKIKKIIFVGGAAAGNRKFLEKYSSELKKRFKKEFEVVDDKFTGVKGALVYCSEKQKSL